MINNLIQTFASLSSLQKTLVLTILATVLYGVSTSISYSLFTNLKPYKGGLTSALPTPSADFEEDPNEPKTEECPLDGDRHTKKAKTFWDQRRPLAVMIENHPEARPQSGLTSADIIYEAVAEGGITRFMAIYYCNLSDVQVGPIRSARTYYLDWLSEYDALYAHVGGANTPGPADALGQIIKYDIKDLNQFSIGFPIFWRDYQRLGHPVATEHTMYSTTKKLWEIGAKREWTATDSAGIRWDENFIPWKFKDDGEDGNISEITVNFWENQSGYKAVWNYDPTTNSYKRKNGDGDHTDLNTKKQLAAKTIIVQFQKESNANDGYPGNIHLLYGTLGSGKALVFEDGNLTEGKWLKQSKISRSKYVDSNNKEIQFNRGQIWIQTVPEGSKVTY